MPTINGKACVANGVPVDKVFSDGKQVYSRNILADSGFESGNIPANYAWGDGKGTGKDLNVVGQAPTYPTPLGNYMLRIADFNTDPAMKFDQYVSYPITPVLIRKGETWTYSYYYASAGTATGQASDYLLTYGYVSINELSMGHDSRDISGVQNAWHRFVKTWTADRDVTIITMRFGFVKTSAKAGWICIDNIKLEQDPAVSPWTPAPEDVM